MKNFVSNRDLELLSAYLDKELSQKDRARVEARLETNPELRRIFGELHQNRAALRSLPRLRAPRNFTLSPKAASVKSQTRTYPALGLVSALSSLVLILVLVGDFLFPPTMTPQLLADQSQPATQVVALEITPDMELLRESEIIETLQVEAPEEAPAAMQVEEAAETESRVMGVEGATEAPAEGTPLGFDIFSSKIPQSTPSNTPPGFVVTPSPTPTAVPPTKAPTESLPTATKETETEKLAESIVPSTPITIEPQTPISGLSLIRILEISLAAVALVTGSVALYLRSRNH